MTQKTAQLGSLIAVACVICFCQSKTQARKVSRSEAYINAQQEIIKRHSAVLVEQGRMPIDFGQEFMVLGQYGWHTSSDSEVGAHPSLALLQTAGSGGSFGAYTFYQPAFEQAKRSWYIHGVMEKGSNILHAMNSNVKFDESVVGYSVSPMYRGTSGAKVVGLFKYSDGSISDRAVILDKISPEFSMQWGMAILPPDYADMCACRM